MLLVLSLEGFAGAIMCSEIFARRILIFRTYCVLCWSKVPILCRKKIPHSHPFHSLNFLPCAGQTGLIIRWITHYFVQQKTWVEFSYTINWFEIFKEDFRKKGLIFLFTEEFLVWSSFQFYPGKESQWSAKPCFISLWYVCFSLNSYSRAFLYLNWKIKLSCNSHKLKNCSHFAEPKLIKFIFFVFLSPLKRFSAEIKNVLAKLPFPYKYYDKFTWKPFVLQWLPVSNSRHSVTLKGRLKVLQLNLFFILNFLWMNYFENLQLVLTTVWLLWPSGN